MIRHCDRHVDTHVSSLRSGFLRLSKGSNVLCSTRTKYVPLLDPEADVDALLVSISVTMRIGHSPMLPTSSAVVPIGAMPIPIAWREMYAERHTWNNRNAAIRETPGRKVSASGHFRCLTFRLAGATSNDKRGCVVPRDTS